jgi:hypothetical protein
LSCTIYWYLFGHLCLAIVSSLLSLNWNTFQGQSLEI